MKITTDRLRQIIKEELMNEVGEQPFRTGLAAGDWQGVGDPRGSGEDAFPTTEPERLGDMIAAKIEAGIRDALQTEFGDDKGMQIFDMYLSEVDESILDIAMRMRDLAMDLSGEPEGVVSAQSEEEAM